MAGVRFDEDRYPGEAPLGGYGSPFYQQEALLAVSYLGPDSFLPEGGPPGWPLHTAGISLPPRFYTLTLSKTQIPFP